MAAWSLLLQRKERVSPAGAGAASSLPCVEGGGPHGVPLLQGREGAGAPWPLVSPERRAGLAQMKGGWVSLGSKDGGRAHLRNQPWGLWAGTGGEGGARAGPGRERPRALLGTGSTSGNRPAGVARGCADRTFREPWGEGSQSRLRGAGGAQASRPGRQRPWAAREGGQAALPLCKLARGLGPLGRCRPGLVRRSGTGGLRPSRRCPRDAPGAREQVTTLGSGAGAPGPPLGANGKTWPLRCHPYLPERRWWSWACLPAAGPLQTALRPDPEKQCF